MDCDQVICPVCALYVLVELQRGEIFGEIRLDDKISKSEINFDMNELFFDPVDMSAEDCYL